MSGWWGRGQDTRDAWEKTKSSKGEENIWVIFGNLCANGWTNKKEKRGCFIK